MAFRKQGSKEVPESAREDFLEALRSGLSQSAAATVAGVCHSTGHRWAKAAGVAANTRHRGIRYPAAVREAFWAAMRAGASLTQASVLAGVSEIAGQAWVEQAGYVSRTPAPVVAPDAPPARVRAPLTFVDRCRLEDLLEGDWPPARAAELLGRHQDTINREIARGHTVSGIEPRSAKTWP